MVRCQCILFLPYCTSCLFYSVIACCTLCCVISIIIIIKGIYKAQDCLRATNALYRQWKCLLSKQKGLNSWVLKVSTETSVDCSAAARLFHVDGHRWRNSCHHRMYLSMEQTADTDWLITRENDQCLQTLACSSQPGTLELNHTGTWTPEMTYWTSVSAELEACSGAVASQV